MSEITEQAEAVTEDDAETQGNQPEVSIIIVSWNVADLLEGCIRSIVEHSDGVSFEVIVVDNASRDHSVQMLAEKFPWVQVIANKENVGFARANNQALPLAKGEFVFFLNPDTLLSGGALGTMVQFLRKNPNGGLVGPRLVYPDGKIQEQCARRLPTLMPNLLSNMFRLSRVPVVEKWLRTKYRFPYDYSTSQEVEAISGAGMLIRKGAVQTLNGFGDCFIHYGEDLDLCFRARRAGWQIWYLSEVVVTHFGGQSSRQTSVRTAVNGALSIQEYFNRCFGKGHGMCYRLAIQLIGVPLIVFVGGCKFLVGTETRDSFQQRLLIAMKLAMWRQIQ